MLAEIELAKVNFLFEGVKIRAWGHVDRCDIPPCDKVVRNEFRCQRSFCPGDDAAETDSREVVVIDVGGVVVDRIGSGAGGGEACRRCRARTNRCSCFAER